MPKVIRPPFDITKEFTVTKPFNYNGYEFSVGNIFTWKDIVCSVKEVYKILGITMA